MQLIVFVGLQGSGKSTFYKERFSETHIRLNMDMLRTRHRESLLLAACLEAKQPTVIDNTNATPEQRAHYVIAAKAQKFEVVGYYFESRIDDCNRRNEQRSEDRIVPLAGLLGTYKRLVRPAMTEGFDRLYYVRVADASGFVVDEWKEAPDEVR